MTRDITNCLVAKLPSVEYYYSRIFQNKSPFPKWEIVNSYFAQDLIRQSIKISKDDVELFQRDAIPARKRQRAHAMEKQGSFFPR